MNRVSGEFEIRYEEGGGHDFRWVISKNGKDLVTLEQPDLLESFKSGYLEGLLESMRIYGECRRNMFEDS